MDRVRPNLRPLLQRHIAEHDARVDMTAVNLVRIICVIVLGFVVLGIVHNAGWLR